MKKQSKHNKLESLADDIGGLYDLDEVDLSDWEVDLPDWDFEYPDWEVDCWDDIL